MKTLFATKIRRVGPTRSRVWTRWALCALVPSVLCLPVSAQTDGSAQQKVEARVPELRNWVRQPQSSAPTNPRHLNAQERAELRKQLSRELRAQAAVSAAR